MNEPKPQVEPHQRPSSVREKEKFSSGGRPWMLILHGKWGLAIDKVLVWATGYSLMTAQYAWATDPAWVHNIRANPHAWIRLQRKNRAVHAHVAQGEERRRLYDILCKKSRSTAGYQHMCAPRELPLVVLRDWKKTGTPSSH